MVPVGTFLQHLVEKESEGLVLKALLNKVLVDPELGHRNELPLRDAREVEAELPPVLLVDIFVTIHCGNKRGSKMNRTDIYWLVLILRWGHLHNYINSTKIMDMRTIFY